MGRGVNQEITGTGFPDSESHSGTQIRLTQLRHGESTFSFEKEVLLNDPNRFDTLRASCARFYYRHEPNISLHPSPKT